MDRVDDRSPRARLDVAVEPLRGRPHPRMRTRRQPAKPAPTDPHQGSKNAWRRYLYAAAHAPSLLKLERFYGR